MRWTDTIIRVLLITISIRRSHGVSISQQLQHIANAHRESNGIANFMPSRRYYDFHPGRSSVILGVPSMASHLPEAEPILPGHTLIRPALDMLKSSVKFPHKDMDNGAGVYGNIDNLGIKYDGRNERVLYSGFRKMNGESIEELLPIDNNKENRISKLIQLLNVFKKDTDKKHNNGEVLKFSHPATLISKNRIYRQSKLNNSLDDFLWRHFSQRRRRPAIEPPFAFVDLDKVHSLRSKPNDSNLIILDVSSGDSMELDDSHDVTNDIETTTEAVVVNVHANPKRNWFWNSKNMFNHIKISPEAPDLTELVPKINVDEGKRWWSYHQADFEPLEELD